MSLGDAGGDFLFAKMSAEGIFDKDNLFAFGRTAFLGTIGSNEGFFCKFFFYFCLLVGLSDSWVHGESTLFFFDLAIIGISSKYCWERLPPFKTDLYS